MAAGQCLWDQIQVNYIAHIHLNEVWFTDCVFNSLTTTEEETSEVRFWGLAHKAEQDQFTVWWIFLKEPQFTQSGANYIVSCTCKSHSLFTISSVALSKATHP